VSYDPDALRRFFDGYAGKEWDRLADSLQGRIKFSVHRHILDKYLKPGIEVLDVGCGPGRFALHMAAAGASLTLVDISDVQIGLARKHLAEAGLADSLRGCHRLDALAMSPLADGAYDLVVCYGSVLSYTRERHGETLRELIRVTKPGGTILVSVTALYGTMRLIGSFDAVEFAKSPEDHLDWQGLLGGAGVVFTKPGSPEFHQPMALFTAAGLVAALTEAGLTLQDLATSNPLVPEGALMQRVAEDPAAAQTLEALEIALCRCPGLLDAGEHLIAAAQKV